MIFQALLRTSLHQAMAMENFQDSDERNNEMSSGWPLGLGNMNMRLRVATVQLQQPHSSTQIRSSSSHSFSSFSSSSQDTQSTASFFPDRSVSLGRLMGIKPAENRGRLSDTNSTSFERNVVVSHDNDNESSRRHCVPLLHIVIDKMSRSKTTLIRH